ncbi:MAG: T9SS type A sorting domain-containing protein [Hymenobacteraceae bacterium]|nr:T9SS type A sorting domain-containing protein [Hymenobacteraceae bacterium]MDX5443347.1 T9SS type A sorting domain-containing protein [Hymenobacteraceae bacterium]
MKKVAFLYLWMSAGVALADCNNPVKYVSITSGNYNAASTWSPIGVPTPCDSVIIRHTVTLPNNETVGSQNKGYLEVTSSGSVSGVSRSLTIASSAKFVNKGNIILSNLYVNGPGAEVINYGTINVRLFTFVKNKSKLTNYQLLFFDNTFSLEGSDLINEFGGNIILRGSLIQSENADGTSVSTVTNKGLFSGWQNWTLNAGQINNILTGTIFINGSLTLEGTSGNTFTNTGFVSVARQFTNNSGSSFTNRMNLVISQDLVNNSSFYNSAEGIITVVGNVINSSEAGAALINDGGHMEILGNLSNAGLMNGTLGTFSVNSTSENLATGIVQGNIDICDKTSNNGGGFDTNLGKIGNKVTFCRILIPLPVTLVSFDAVLQKNEVLLKWVTATEKNSQKFVIERAAEGNEFLPIGQVDAAGNSNTMIHYQFTDPNPHTGTSYYRLKQIDFDGSIMYSKIVSVNMEQQPFTATVFPNPLGAGQELKLEVRGTGNQELQLSIFNTLGQVMYSQTATADEVLGEVTVPANLLQKGVYLLQLTDNSSKKALVQKLVVQ